VTYDLRPSTFDLWLKFKVVGRVLVESQRSNVEGRFCPSSLRADTLASMKTTTSFEHMRTQGHRHDLGSAIWVFQHVACEHLGTLRRSVAASSVPLRFFRVCAGDAVPKRLTGCAGLIVLGGPMSVNDQRSLPYLGAELRLLEAALVAEVPVLGVCLGSQLLAHAAGARVYRGAEKEIGWYPIERAAAAASDPVFGRFPHRAMVFHWHGETFDLPRGAAWLAHSARYTHQAFRIGRSAYGLQFHVEVTVPMIRSWCRAYRGEWGEYAAQHRVRVPPDRAAGHARRLSAMAQGVGSWFAQAASSARVGKG